MSASRVARRPASSAASSGVTCSTSPPRLAGAEPPVCSPCWAATVAAYGHQLGLLLEHGRQVEEPLQRDDGRLGVVVRPDDDRVADGGVLAARRHQGEEAGQLARRGLDELRPGLHERCGVGRVEEDRRVDDVADLGGLDLDGGEDAEVRARAAHGPEQVGLVLRVGPHEPAVGEDQLGGDHVVEREPVRAAEEALPARGHQPADADVAVVAGADRQPVRRRARRRRRPSGRPHRAGRAAARGRAPRRCRARRRR